MTIFDKFNEKFNASKLAEEVKELGSNNRQQGDYEDVPFGMYEVKVEKMKLKESKSGRPMVSIWFRIIEGDFKNSIIFMNQVVEQPFQIHIVKELLAALESGLDIEFVDYNQFNDLLLDIHQAIDGKLEYALDYQENDKGFNVFKIKEVYEV